MENGMGVGGVSDGAVPGKKEGTVTIAASLEDKEAVCRVTVKKAVESISLDNTRLDMNAGKTYQLKAGSGGPAGGNIGQSASLPDDVVSGTWTEANGTWQFADASGQLYRNRWAAVSNPYANTAAGQSAFDWFFFDAAGNMLTGWYLNTDGNYYYLNPASDGTRGRMLRDTVVEGYTLNAEGQWVVNGVVSIM